MNQNFVKIVRWIKSIITLHLCHILVNSFRISEKIIFQLQHLALKSIRVYDTLVK